MLERSVLMGYSDTIAAVSTPRGSGGIAVIRISGSRCCEILARVFEPVGNYGASSLPPRRACFGNIYSVENGKKNLLDEGIVTYYKAPASYTGEDMAEISCHGGVLVTRAVLAAVLAAGAVPAEAGEFTRRAFISGKISLTKAEAVGNMLYADTDDRLKLAAAGLSGRLSGEISDITGKLYSAMTALYAAIDYPEEDLAEISSEEVAEVLNASLDRIKKLLSTYKRGKAVSDGVKCVICGKPNAGKSSLYNLIVGEDSAIVTDIAGTTRDVLRESVSFGGVTLLLADTAGLRSTKDTVELIGVDRARREISGAELIISVFDGAAGVDGDERQMISSYPAVPRIAVINKGDLESALTPEDLAFIKENHSTVVNMTCADGSGLSSLAEEVGKIYDAGECDLSCAVVWSARQEAMLRRAGEYLKCALDSHENGDPVDAVCTLCECAIGELSETDGRGVSEEIVNGIFSKFCVGK